MSPAADPPGMSPSSPAQACDRCRVQKLRCEIDPQAQHCIECIAAYELCSWDLPPLDTFLKPPRRGPSAFNTSDSDESGASSLNLSRQSSATTIDTPLKPRDKTFTAHRSGPSSIPYIIHSMPTLPIGRVLSEYCMDRGFRMVRTDGLDGYISVTSEVDATPHPPPSNHLWHDAVDQLVVDYIDHVGELLPIVTASEAEQAGPVLRHAMAAVAATRSTVPAHIFEAIRHSLPHELEQADVHFIPTLENVQTLLVLCLVDELGDRPRISPVSVQRDRLGAAYRLALDLGLTRSRLEREVRVWRCLQIIDTWRAARDGVPMLHQQVFMSDANSTASSTLSSTLNSPAVSPPISSMQQPGLSVSVLSKATPSNAFGVTFFERLYSLTRLLARVLGLMYGPEGVTETDPSAMRKLQQDLTSWRDSLPISLKFDYNSAKFQTVRTQRRVQESGLLLVYYTGVRFLFFRPLMPWSFHQPKKFKQSIHVTTEEWVDLMKLSRYSVDFAINLEETTELLFFFGVYTLNLACLVLYHTWARRGEWEGSIYLDKARRCYDRLLHGPGTHLPFLKRDMSMVEMLLGITELSRDQFGTRTVRGLNPTPGVLNSLAESTVSGVMMLREGDGEGFIMVATPEAARDLQDLPPGTIVLGALPDEDRPDSAVPPI